MRVTYEFLLTGNSESLKRTWYTCQSRWPRRSNQEPRSWANGFFKIEGFAGKRSLLSPPPLPSFHLFALVPFFARSECEKLIRAARISFASYGNACYAGYSSPVSTGCSFQVAHLHNWLSISTSFYNLNEHQTWIGIQNTYRCAQGEWSLELIQIL